ncbi:MAG: FMN-binding protein [Eubacteriales bacterium]|nr:FMN-binding protein [Eubacteriales bacterium]
MKKPDTITKKIIYPALSLFLICLVSVLLLALTNELTKDQIEKNNRGNEVTQREVVFPGAKSYRELQSHVECIDKDGNVIGYIFVTQGKGYGGDITVMTGINTSGIITGVEVLSHTETSSYGGVAISSGLTDEYKDKEASIFVKGRNIDGWTGATRTTNGVIAAVNDAVIRYNTLKERGESADASQQ